MLIALASVIWIVCCVLAHGLLVNTYKQQTFSYIRYGFGWTFLSFWGLAIFNQRFNSDGFIYMTREEFDREYK
jgi:hypothetical protein